MLAVVGFLRLRHTTLSKTVGKHTTGTHEEKRGNKADGLLTTIQSIAISKSSVIFLYVITGDCCVYHSRYPYAAFPAVSSVVQEPCGQRLLRADSQSVPRILPAVS